MEIGIVLIGVARAGQLPRLQAVYSGLEAMQGWARGQGIQHIRIVSDADDATVTVDSIYRAVEQMVKKPTLERLIIYYAGHGVNKGYGEYWLLSEAPENPNAAIDLEQSITLAQRGSGIPHVVIFSDACRTAPDKIRALSVTGSSMFPNKPPTRKESLVHVFYACRLGEPSSEIEDLNDSARNYRSIYTDVLVESLEFQQPQAIDRAEDGHYEFVRPSSLQRALEDLVARRLRDLDLWRKLSQTPDGKLRSPVSTDLKDAWISRREAPPLPLHADEPEPERRPITLSAIALRSVNRAMAVVDGVGPADTVTEESVQVPGADALGQAAANLASGFGPSHFETGAGFKVRGARFSEAFSVNAETSMLADELVAVLVGEGMVATSVLLRFESGVSALLPAVRQFITALTFEEDRLVDVAYEPMDTSDRWELYANRADQVRAARATVAASSRMGLLNLDDQTAEAMARHMQHLKGIDPSLAIYAAYAYHDLGLRERIQEMVRYLAADLGFVFYDVALVSGQLESGDHLVTPSVPIFSRGWALASAFGAEIPSALRNPETRALSPWTLFTPPSYEVIGNAMTRGEIW